MHITNSVGSGIYLILEEKHLTISCLDESLIMKIAVKRDDDYAEKPTSINAINYVDIHKSVFC